MALLQLLRTELLEFRACQGIFDPQYLRPGWIFLTLLIVQVPKLVLISPGFFQIIVSVVFRE